MQIEKFAIWLLLILALSSIESLSFKKEWIKQLLPQIPIPSLSYFPSYPKMNSSLLRTAMFSCLEEKRYESVANYVNCHIFCPSCNQGFGRCVDSSEGLKLCVCDCQYPVQLHKECPSVMKYCKSETMFDFGKVRRNSDALLGQCKKACVSLGFSDGALCGLDDNNDSTIVKSTCTCLCPKLSLD